MTDNMSEGPASIPQDRSQRSGLRSVSASSSTSVSSAGPASIPQNRSQRSGLRSVSASSSTSVSSAGETQHSRTPRSSFVELASMSMASSKQNVMAKLTAGFISLNNEEPEASKDNDSRCGRFRSTLKVALGSSPMNIAMAIIIFADIAVGIIQINTNAAETETPTWVSMMSIMILVVYTADLVVNLTALWPDCRRNAFFLMDAVIVGFAIMDYVVQAMAVDMDEIGLMRFLRVFRIMRLLRIFRRVGFVQRLHQLLLMAASSAKTLLWTFILCGCVLLFWSMAAVELLHPAVQLMDSEGRFKDCARCGQAFSSVPHAFLTLFKLTMTGEDFGLLAEPLMLELPWSAILLMGSMLSVVYGILNLVVAVVVDEFAERRANDYMARADEMDDELKTDIQRLNKIFHMVDEDGSGEVSLEELQSGAKRVPEFRNTLRWMDIDEADIQQLFDMLDGDDSGEIELAEFVGVLSRWMRDSKTAGRFVKYNLLKVQEEQASMRETIMEFLSRMTDRLQQLSDDVNVLHAQAPPAVASAGNTCMKNDIINQHSRDLLHHVPVLEFAREDSTIHLDERASELFQTMSDQLRQLLEDLRIERTSGQQTEFALQPADNFSKEEDTILSHAKVSAELTKMYTSEAITDVYCLHSPCQPAAFLLPQPKDVLQSGGDSEQECIADTICQCRV
eukprot:TRINITY_DN5193_c0_g1_i2.p1 TRINITY_DN5193_c0_g1~~TRINITY_DN5193_c0_g1_i2.p1  ORF type:complete len:720 (-),score=116.83 TRINITY_DN5193_c0_g1_i2:96-2129(-)